MGERLGQNFLKDENVVKKIIQVADLKKDDVVLEVGPGKGVLTEELAKNAGKVLAVEIDGSLLDTLRGKLSNFKNVEIINEDILNVDILRLLESHLSVIPAEAGIQRITGGFDRELDPRLRGDDNKKCGDDNKKCGDDNKECRKDGIFYKLIANIPYYITSKIIRLFLEADNPPSEMILMVQKEVAERIVAKPGQMSILAVSVQYYAEAEILFEVPKEAFDPAPEVDSAVIRITRRKEPSSPAGRQKTRNKEEIGRFFRVVKAGFCARRKTLVNNLSNSLHLDKKEVEEKLKTVGILPIARAQELSIEDWKKISNIF